ncbi:ATP-binding protein [Nonomuraea guangzhouensis]|uniref:ATP-binding protein n=1 Tax=Nonomuraea guangzhouensis TaxID=1291555 RepID=A0ABW4G1C5_9ACTN|nr:ATP-binding protein [Nonomuraea guangzhouensis]
MLPPTPQLPQVRELIERDRYFVLHAPRQTGKTTALYTLASELNAEGDIAALMFSCERAKAAGDDYAAAEAILLQSLREAATWSGWTEALLPPDPWPQAAPGSRFGAALSEWCRRCPRRVVLILDEIDALQGSSMVSIFRQLRDGHNARHEGRPFPSSVVLCGLRDVPEYKVTSGGNRDWSSPGSPFNIITESLRLGDFTADEIAELYDQHTQATGQEFTKDAVDRIFELAQGQPWLVNALAYEITFRMRVSGAITTAQVDEAKERLIRERPVHLDALMARLHEPRVERVIRAIMAGTMPGTDASFDDDVSYVHDLGLIRGTGEAEIANPIYREVLLRRRLLGADLLRHQEQDDPFTDEALAKACLRIFGHSNQHDGRM